MNKVELDPGSFRDPAGKIFYYNEKILRVLDSEGEDRYKFLKKDNKGSEKIRLSFKLND